MNLEPFKRYPSVTSVFSPTYLPVKDVFNVEEKMKNLWAPQTHRTDLALCLKSPKAAVCPVIELHILTTMDEAHVHSLRVPWDTLQIEEQTVKVEHCRRKGTIYVTSPSWESTIAMQNTARCYILYPMEKRKQTSNSRKWRSWRNVPRRTWVIFCVHHSTNLMWHTISSS